MSEIKSPLEKLNADQELREKRAREFADSIKKDSGEKDPNYIPEGLTAIEMRDRALQEAREKSASETATPAEKRVVGNLDKMQMGAELARRQSVLDTLKKAKEEANSRWAQRFIDSPSSVPASPEDFPVPKDVYENLSRLMLAGNLSPDISAKAQAFLNRDYKNPAIGYEEFTSLLAAVDLKISKVAKDVADLQAKMNQEKI